MASGSGNFEINHEALKKAAQDLADQRSALWEALRVTHSQISEMTEVMQTRAGARITERFNNLVSTYFDRYANSMEAHARYLYEAAERYEATDDTLKAKADNALKNFDEV